MNYALMIAPFLALLRCRTEPMTGEYQAIGEGNYQIRLSKYIIVKARQEAGGRRQEENNCSIKTGFSIRGKRRYNQPDN